MVGRDILSTPTSLGRLIKGELFVVAFDVGVKRDTRVAAWVVGKQEEEVRKKVRDASPVLVGAFVVYGLYQKPNKIPPSISFNTLETS